MLVVFLLLVSSSFATIQEEDVIDEGDADADDSSVGPDTCGQDRDVLSNW